VAVEDLNTEFLRKTYKTSPMREGVLCWYPFKENAVVHYGGEALSELFAHRGLVVEKRLNPDTGYDYVVIVDPEFPDGFTSETFGKYKNALNRDGKLLFAYENPFGLRYFAGKMPSLSPIVYPYESLYGRAVGVSRPECVSRLKSAGFNSVKSYYPFTDHWFAQEIYSENHLPNRFLGHRLIPYIDSATPLLFDERFLYGEAIRGGAFEFLCPAYLLEAGIGSEVCPVDYAAVTTYRFKRNRFATLLCNDGTAKKIPLCAEAAEKAKQTAKTHSDLEKLGVNVLPLKIGDDGTLTMKRVNAPILIDHWCEKWEAGTLVADEVIGQYDTIKSEIDKASACGVCYCELVPANCFIEDGKLVFFDQEFSCGFGDPKYAADVAMTRAILALTIYNHARWGFGIKDDAFITNVVDGLKSKYGLAENWVELVKAADEGVTQKEIFSDALGPLAIASSRIQERSEAARKFTREAAREAARAAAYISCVSMLKDRGIASPIIYGYGLRGRALRYAFEDENIDIPAIVDKDGSRLRHIFRETEVFASLKEAVGKHKHPADCIIISPLDHKPIMEEIEEQFGGKIGLPIYTLTELLEQAKNEL
jgi:hypothetical protein